MLLTSLVLGLVSGFHGLDPASALLAAQGRCDVINPVIGALPTTAAASASAFCTVYNGVKTQIVTAAPSTTTVTSRCSLSSFSGQTLAKRSIAPSRFVRSVAAPCPTFMTALGTAALSKACSCLATTSTVTVTPTSTYTSWIQATTTSTSVVTVVPSPYLVYTTVFSSFFSTSTSTLTLVRAFSAASIGTVYSTETNVKLTSVTTTIVLPTTTISTSTTTTTASSTSTVYPIVKRANIQTCSVVTTVITSTVSAMPSTKTSTLYSSAYFTVRQVDTVQSDSTTTLYTTMTLPTIQVVSSTATAMESIVSTKTETTTTTTTNTSPATVTASYRTNVLDNPGYESDLDSWSHSNAEYYPDYKRSGYQSARIFNVEGTGILAQTVPANTLSAGSVHVSIWRSAVGHSGNDVFCNLALSFAGVIVASKDLDAAFFGQGDFSNFGGNVVLTLDQAARDQNFQVNFTCANGAATMYLDDAFLANVI